MPNITYAPGILKIMGKLGGLTYSRCKVGFPHVKTSGGGKPNSKAAGENQSRGEYLRGLWRKMTPEQKAAWQAWNAAREAENAANMADEKNQAARFNARCHNGKDAFIVLGIKIGIAIGGIIGYAVSPTPPVSAHPSQSVGPISPSYVAGRLIVSWNPDSTPDNVAVVTIKGKGPLISKQVVGRADVASGVFSTDTVHAAKGVTVPLSSFKGQVVTVTVQTINKKTGLYSLSSRHNVKLQD